MIDTSSMTRNQIQSLLSQLIGNVGEFSAVQQPLSGEGYGPDSYQTVYQNQGLTNKIREIYSLIGVNPNLASMMTPQKTDSGFIVPFNISRSGMETDRYGLAFKPDGTLTGVEAFKPDDNSWSGFDKLLMGAGLAGIGYAAAPMLFGGAGAGATGAYVSPEIAGMAAQTIPAAGTSSTGLLGGLGGLMDGIAPALPSGTGFGLTGGTGLSGGTIMGDALLTGGGLAPGIATATAGGSNMGWFSKAFDWITGDIGSNILGRLGSSAIQGLFANNTANNNIDAARDSLSAQMALGNRALDEARFKPVNVTSNLGSTSWEIGPDGKPTAATANLSPQMQQLIAQAMSKGLDTLGGISAGTPEQLAQAEFQRYLNYARPKQNDLFSSLQNRMSAQGVLGFGVGDTNATSYNPLYRDFASGIADSDYNAYKQSQTLAQDLTNQNLKRALTLFGAGTEADAYGTNLLKLSGELGGRNVNAAGANALLTAGTAGNQSLLSATQAGNAAVGSIFGNAAQQMGPLLTAILGGLNNG